MNAPFSRPLSRRLMISRSAAIIGASSASLLLPQIAYAQSSPINILAPNDFNRSMGDLVNDGNGPTPLNSTWVQGFDWGAGPHSLNPGPTVLDLPAYTGVLGPNNSTSRAGIGSGTTGAQIYGTKMGMFLNGFADGGTLAGNTTNQSIAFGKQMSASCWQNAATYLHAAVTFDARSFWSVDPANRGCYAYVSLWFDIPGARGSQCIMVYLWDNRVTPLAHSTVAEFDPHGNKFLMTDCYSNSDLISNAGSDSLRGPQGGSGQFYFDLTHANVRRILDLFGFPSLQPEQVQLSAVTYQGELFNIAGGTLSNSQFGCSFDNTILSVF